MRAGRLTAFCAPMEFGAVRDPDPPADRMVLQVLACGVCRSNRHAQTGADRDIARRSPAPPGSAAITDFARQETP